MQVVTEWESGSRPPIAALIFDMDGLLVDSESVAGEALRAFLHGHGHEMGPDVMERALGRRLPEAVAALAEYYALPGPIESLVATFDRLRLDALRGRVVAMPGAEELLSWATANGLPSALATSSGRHHADLSLAEAGLAGRFRIEVTGDEVEHGKPAPDLFLLAADRLGIEPACCLVLEDAPAGLEAAARAGMRRVWVPNMHTRHLTPTVPVDAILNGLASVPDWLESYPLLAGATSAPAAASQIDLAQSD